jgi:TPR repeat protein
MSRTRSKSPQPRNRSKSPSRNIPLDESYDQSERLYNRGLFHEKKQQYNLAFQNYILSSKKGYPQSYLKLGKCYHLGIGTPVDRRKGYLYYVIAEANGVPHSNCLLGLCYLEGIGVEKDAKRSLEFYIKCINDGCQYSVYIMGILYIEGNGVSKDVNMGIRLLNSVKQEYYYRAQCYLGKYYESINNSEMAIVHYEKLLEIKDDFSLYRLGCLNYTTDPIKAIGYLTLSAYKGNTSSLVLSERLLSNIS